MQSDPDPICEQDLAQKKIRHLVIPGGGVSGLIYYGALRQTHEDGLWNIADIQSIYSTSVGGFLAFTIALGHDFQTIEDYLVQRPWNQLFKYDIYSILGAFEKRGIFHICAVEDMFRPLLLAKDLSMDITMAEFYEWSGIDIHCFATDINSFGSVDISHKTHPDWRMIDALYASACLPIFFAPFGKDDKYYVDGGIFLNYPVSPCLDNGADPAEILGVRKIYKTSNKNTFTSSCNLMDYVMILMNKILGKMTKDSCETKIAHEICVEDEEITIDDLFHMASSVEYREKCVAYGKEVATQYYMDCKNLVNPSDVILES
jgi:predicted acylesterase/phospholipase RssA